MTAPLSPESTRGYVQMMLHDSPNVPAEHTGALVLVVNQTHVEVAVGTRGESGWTVNLAARFAWNGERKIEAIIKKTW